MLNEKDPFYGKTVSGYNDDRSITSAVHLDNMKIALRLIKRGNELRGLEGYAPLKVSHSLMAIGQSQANLTSTIWPAGAKSGHTHRYDVGENLNYAGGSSSDATHIAETFDPYGLWYFQEKKIYDQDPMSKGVGHYLTLTDRNGQNQGYPPKIMEATGFGVTRAKRRPSWETGTMMSQVFAQNADQPIWDLEDGETLYSVDEYTAMFDEYYKSVDPAAQQQALKDAQAELAAAKKDIEVKQQAIQAAEDAKASAAAELASKQQAAEVAAQAVADAQSAVATATSDLSGSETNTAAKGADQQQAKEALAAAEQAKAEAEQAVAEAGQAVTDAKQAVQDAQDAVKAQQQQVDERKQELEAAEAGTALEQARERLRQAEVAKQQADEAKRQADNALTAATQAEAEAATTLADAERAVADLTRVRDEKEAAVAPSEQSKDAAETHLADLQAQQQAYDEAAAAAKAADQALEAARQAADQATADAKQAAEAAQVADERLAEAEALVQRLNAVDIDQVVADGYDEAFVEDAPEVATAVDALRGHLTRLDVLEGERPELEQLAEEAATELAEAEAEVVEARRALPQCDEPEGDVSDDGAQSGGDSDDGAQSGSDSSTPQVKPRRAADESKQSETSPGLPHSGVADLSVLDAYVVVAGR